MHQTVVPVSGVSPVGKTAIASDSVQITIHIQTEVMTPAAAQRKVNVWLSLNAGHLLVAEHPEFVIADPLQWRFDCILCSPALGAPGKVRPTSVGRMSADAVTGEVINPDTLLPELTAHAEALTLHLA